jgi:hypothetical protein
MSADIITHALSPAVAISSIGLFMLSLSNRMTTVGTRVRQLNQNLIHANTKEECDNIHQQLDCFMHRARMIRNALSVLSMAICFMVLTMLSLAIIKLHLLWIPDFLPLMLFLLGLLLIFIATVIELKETSLNIAALKLDIQFSKQVSANKNLD